MQRNYVSADAVNRYALTNQDAADLHQHPVELKDVPSLGTLMIDFDHVLFADQAAAIELALCWLFAVGIVGIHTYYPDDPQLAAIAVHQRAVIARTQEEMLQRLAKLPEAQAA